MDNILSTINSIKLQGAVKLQFFAILFSGIALSACNTLPRAPVAQTQAAATPTAAAPTAVVSQAKKVDANQAAAVQTTVKPVEIKNDRPDPTGLIGKTITPPALPKNSGTNLISFGNDYYYCGGSMFGDEKLKLGLDSLRKGFKTKCGSSKQIIALTRSSNNNKTTEFIDVMALEIPKGYTLMSNDCKGADVVITKFEDKEVLVNHLKAWRIVDNLFVPVANLKKITCAGNVGGE